MSDTPIETPVSPGEVLEINVEAPAVEVDEFDPSEDDEFTLPSGTKTYDEKYVTKLREQAAKYRTKAKEMESQYGAFQGLDPDDFGWFANAASTYKEGGLNALTEYARPLYADLIEAGVTPAQAEAVVEKVEEAAESGKPLDEAAIEKILDQKLTAKEEAARKEADFQKEIANVTAVLQEAGYPHGTPEAEEILNRAVAHKITVQEAIKRYEAFKQSLIDNYVQSKASAPRTVNGTAGAETPRQPRNGKEAAEMARAYMEAEIAAGRSL